MLVVEALGKGETTAIHDGSVVTVVADDEIVLREELRDDTAVHGETCGEHQGFVLAYESCELFFQLHMDIQGSVEETGSGAAAAVFLQRLDAGVDDSFVSGESGVCVGTEHHNLVTVHGHLGSLFAGYLAEIRIDILFHHLLGKIIFGQSGV